MPQTDELATQTAQDLLPLIAIDHIEFYVGNARQAAHFYQSVLGFRMTAYQGPETGIHDRASYVLEQEQIRLVLTTAMRPNHPIADHVYKHGDAVRNVAFSVDDAKTAYSVVKERGGRIVHEPSELRDENGVVRMFAVGAYGDTVHTLVDRTGFEGRFMPGYAAVDKEVPHCGLLYVDHVAANVRLGETDECAEFYRSVLGFTDGETDGARVMSKRGMRFPIHEPVGGEMQPHVEEYLNSHQGPGVQHIALATADLEDTLGMLRARGLEFASGTRMFTRPVSDRPTLCFEIVQVGREGC